MSGKLLTKLDIESEIEELGEAITAHNNILHELKVQRCDLISKIQDLEFEETLKCAMEYDISPRRVMDLIITEMEERKKRIGA